MANSTAYLGLPLYQDSDIPDLTAQYNQAMSTLDSYLSKRGTSAIVGLNEIGCVPDDPSFDNAAIINDYLSKNDCMIYVPRGDWYIKAPLELGYTSIICDGFIACDRASAFTGPGIRLTFTKFELSEEGEPAGVYRLKVKNSPTGQPAVEVSDAITTIFDIDVRGVIDTGVRFAGRCVENMFIINVIAPVASRASIGMTDSATVSNDNTFHVTLKNCNVGFDTFSSFMYFRLFHAWGCGTGIRFNDDSYCTFTDLYIDYCNDGIDANGNNVTLNSTNTYFLTGDANDDFFIKSTSSVKGKFGHVRSSSDVLFAKKFAREFVSTPDISVEMDPILIAFADSNTMSLEQLKEKYSDHIASDALICGMAFKWEGSNTLSSLELIRESTIFKNFTDAGLRTPQLLEYSKGSIVEKTTIYRIGRATCTIVPYANYHEASPYISYLVYQAGAPSGGASTANRHTWAFVYCQDWS